MAFLDYLIQKGIITAADQEKLQQQVSDTDTDLVEVLAGQGMDKKQLMQWKSEYFAIPVRDLDPTTVPQGVLNYIPEDTARHHQIVPIARVDDVVEIGMVNPDNTEARDVLQSISSKLNTPFKLFLISHSDFTLLMNRYAGAAPALVDEAPAPEPESIPNNLPTEPEPAQETPPIAAPPEIESATPTPEPVTEPTSEPTTPPPATQPPAASAAPEPVADPTPAAPQATPTPQRKDFDVKVIEDTPITKIVAVLLRHATEGGASDVHVEPGPDRVRVRFRVDGVLYTSLFLPNAVHKSVIARIKVLAKLKLDERRKPQDGSFSARIEKRKIDFRVSTFPTNYGEKVVMRILDPGKGMKTLEETGLKGHNLELIRNIIKKPFGLVLLAGPTGSGKSTSLYAMLNELDTEARNVVSLEDPVEYNIAGVSQSHVRPEIGYTFANGLRSLLRQDPDIIMVGEIRDKETAELAIQAALTGHLVISTIHTNSAVGVVPRLVDMGVDPYLIAPTLVAAIGQRLVPTICESSKKPLPIEGSMQTMLERQFADIPEQYRANIPRSEQVYDTAPSPECPGGTRGRIGVFEVMLVDKDIEKVILENPLETALLKAVREKGMFTLKEDALFKSFEGIVPFHEVNKLE